MELKICHLYPDVMNISGDRGNLICMEKRLQWRGIDVVITGVGVGQELTDTFDLYFIGNGQPFSQPLLLEDMAKKREMLRDAAEDGAVFLAICGGYQLLGRAYEENGETFEGLGILDVQTKYAATRLVGDYAFSCEVPQTTVVGFENHNGRTYLGDGVQPLGKTTQGHGNNGEDGTEGARYKNVFASYAHGCLLGKNPVLCDHILLTALERKYGTVELAPLDDALELSAHRYMENRLAK